MSLPSLARIAPVAFVLGSCATLVSAADPFTIVALPDTQNYVNNAANAPLFTQQTQWIVDQITGGNPRNIQFVTHLGDVVSTGSNLTQWDRAETSMSVLEPGGMPIVPYGILPGNHDYNSTGNKSTGTDNYVAYFGPTRFASAAWYLDAEPSGNNSAQVFTVDGQTYLHLALEWQPTVNVTNGPQRDPSPVEWARSVIAANPTLPVIISTHEYIDDDPPGRSGAGQALWNELVNEYDQIFMVLNGHFHSVGGGNDGEYHQVSLNAYGKPVLEILQDYQDYPNGGDGWLRLITFDPDVNEIRFETYSPVLDQYQTETVGDVGQYASEFTLALDFATRFQFEAPPEPPVEVFDEVVIADGLEGYAGTADKEIRSDGNDGANGDAPEISIDGDDGSPGLQPNQALLRFSDFVGMNPGQIAPGTMVDSATIELNVINPGSGFMLHAMTTAWDETTTFADLGGDGITPGIEADAAPLLTLGADNSSENVPVGILSLDLTSTIQSWIDGAPNEGLGFIPFPNGTNGIDITTSESGNPPRIVIRSLKPGLSLTALAQDAGGYDGAADTMIRAETPDTAYGDATELSVDSSDPDDLPNQVLLRFDDLEQHGLSADVTVVRAWLTVVGTNPGAGGSVHRMLIDWSPLATWNTFGGDGIQADDLEAALLAETFVVGATGTVQIELTDAVRAWQADPSSNHGVAILPGGSDGWDFISSEGAAPSRPTLTIVTEMAAACPEDIDDSGSVDFADLVALLAAWGATPDCPSTTPADVNGDCAVDFADLVTLLSAWGACPN